MSKLIVSVAAVFALAAAVVASATAQSVRVGATVRVSDDVVVGISYGRPYPVAVVIADRLHHGRVGHRHPRLHRKAWKHRRWGAAFEREHRRLHRDMRRGYVSVREHRRWHEAVARAHR